MNVGSLLTNAGVSYPDHPSFIFQGETRSYGESLQRADRLCHALAELDVGVGDRVALYLQNCPELIEAFFAVWKLGAVVVPLNPTLTPDEVEWHLNDCGAMAAIVDRDCARAVAVARSATPGLAHVIGVGEACEGAEHELEELLRHASSEAYPARDVEPAQLAWLGYTSGTTGRPKGAMLSHGALIYQGLTALADAARLEHHHVGMHASPLAHASGHNAVVFTMKACTQVIHQGIGFDSRLFLEQVEKYRVAAVFLVPTQVKLVVDHPDARTRDLSSVRWIIYGGAPMYRQDQKRALGVLGPVLVQIFGQAESPMSGTVLPCDEHSRSDDDARACSVGRVRTGLEIRVVDEQDTPVRSGESGEICIRGATLMNGYWNRPDATAETLRGGWLHTGDIGYLDERGYLYIQDRLKDMIISGGLNVYPKEVEDVLLTHPDVDEVCVIGVPHPKWGEAVHAVVVPARDVQPCAANIIDFVGSKLAPYKRPKSVEFVDSLPKSAYGKIEKRAVRAPYWDHLDSRV